MIDRVRLERFVDEYADRAYGFAMALCEDSQKASDLVQDAFVKLLDHAESLEGQGMDQWFLTVMKRLYLDGLRRMDNRPKLSLDSVVGEEELTVAEAVADQRDEDLCARLERVEMKGLVRRGLRGLSPEHKTVLLMIDMNGMGYEETAAALGVPLNTVRSRIVRARDALRERMRKLEVTP